MVSLAILSEGFGYVSIGCWLCAQLPQVVKNYRLKSCEGLSLPFLITWLLGDLGNLVGCILTEQLPFQTYLAGYFCIVDLSLLYQFFYYRKIARPRIASRDSFTPHLSQSLILPPAPPSSPHLRTATSERPRHTRGFTEPIYGDEHAAVYAAVLDVARAAERATRTRSRSRPARNQMMESYHSELSNSTVESPQDMRASSASLLDRGRNMSRAGLSEVEPRDVRDPSRSLSVRGSEERNRGRRKAGVAFMAIALLVTSVRRSQGTVLDHHPPPSFQRVVGRLSAWACTTLYLSSRLPQIWKNFTRRSVEGLSMYLFLFAFLGNTFYVISIMLNPARSEPLYLLEALPYLLGSGGTLVFDITILSQSLVYGSAPPSDDTPYQRFKRLRYDRRAHVEDGIEREPLMADEARERSTSPDVALRTQHKAKTQP